MRCALLHDPLKRATQPGYPPRDVDERIAELSPAAVECLAPDDVVAGRLAAFDVLCVPGGFAPHYAAALGVEGAAAVRRFVSAGGGFVGVCAGAFLASELGLLPVVPRDVDHVGAPSTPCRIVFSDRGQVLLGGSAAATTARYANGPLFSIVGRGVEILASYASSCRPASACMEFSPAILSGFYGGGRVVLFSPHLEDGVDQRTRTPFRNAISLAAAAS